MKALETAVASIEPLDASAMAKARARLDDLTKPLGSLGRLEELVMQLAGITGEPAPSVSPRSVVVVAADHGVAARGVSAYPATVTAEMVANFVAGGAAINVLSRVHDADLLVVDAGVASTIPVPIPGSANTPNRGRFISRPIRRGTADMSLGPAMTRDEACAAMALGLELADDLAARGQRVVAVGEMGIGNTTAASAVTAVLLAREPRDVTGRGTGIADAVLAHKIRIVEQALEVNGRDPRDPIGTVAAVGGLEIATLAGLILGAAAHRIPVVLDGFITGSAALVAARLCPALPPRLVAAHRSAEPGHRAILDELRLDPLFDLGLRLGEGSGAVLALALLDAACALRDGMATFASAAIASKIS